MVTDKKKALFCLKFTLKKFKLILKSFQNIFFKIHFRQIFFKKFFTILRPHFLIMFVKTFFKMFSMPSSRMEHITAIENRTSMFFSLHHEIIKFLPIFKHFCRFVAKFLIILQFLGSEECLTRCDSYGNVGYLKKKIKNFILKEICSRTDCPHFGTFALLLFPIFFFSVLTMLYIFTCSQISGDVAITPKTSNKTAPDNLVFSPVQRAARFSHFFIECQYFSSHRETLGGTTNPSGALRKSCTLDSHDLCKKPSFPLKKTILIQS